MRARGTESGNRRLERKYIFLLPKNKLKLSSICLVYRKPI